MSYELLLRGNSYMPRGAPVHELGREIKTQRAKDADVTMQNEGAAVQMKVTWFSLS